MPDLSAVRVTCEDRGGEGLSLDEQRAALAEALEQTGIRPRRMLLIPPDATRRHSGAGPLTVMARDLAGPDCVVDILPALGSHQPVSEDECAALFGPTVRHADLLVHRWRDDVVRLGEIPAARVCDLSEGQVDQPVDVEINRRIVEGGYDLILSLGQVVPHEVAGMANHNKNLFVGCGGASMISRSHLVGAFFGTERIMGRDHTPVRALFDEAERTVLPELPLLYVQTVTTADADGYRMHGLFIGSDRRCFEDAVRLSLTKNLTYVDRPLNHVVVWLDEDEFHSTWVGNKAIYRTRMAIADGGRLTVLAPGVRRFGEDGLCDRLIRKYGYRGRDTIRGLYRQEAELQHNQAVPAHLIHGSSDGRFSVTYATRHLSADEVTGVGFAHRTLDDALRQYDPRRLTDGFNTVDGEEIYFVPHPAMGLWTTADRFAPD